MFAKNLYIMMICLNFILITFTHLKNINIIMIIKGQVLDKKKQIFNSKNTIKLINNIKYKYNINIYILIYIIF
jgi:hypothetical protein